MNHQFTLCLAPTLALPYLAAATLACATSTTVGAQDSTSNTHSGWLVGGSFGVPGYRSEPAPELMTVGLHWTQVQPGRLGADFSLGTMPRALVEGVMVLGVRAGVALPLSLSPAVLLLPSGGVSLVGGGAPNGGGGGVAGLNAGVAAVVSGASSVGLRTGITWHRFQGSRAAVWLLELGVVRLPRRSA